jgi:hypothetical protein
LAERSLGSPLRRPAPIRHARSTSPPRGLPLIALDWTSEFPPTRLAPYGLMLPPWASSSQARPKADRIVCATWYATRRLRERMVHTLSRLSCPLSCVQSFSGYACLRPPAYTSTPANGLRHTSKRPQAASRGVCWLYDACGVGQRPAPGLPHPAVLRLQAFSTS